MTFFGVGKETQRKFPATKLPPLSFALHIILGGNEIPVNLMTKENLYISQCQGPYSGISHFSFLTFVCVGECFQAEFSVCVNILVWPLCVLVCVLVCMCEKGERGGKRGRGLELNDLYLHLGNSEFNLQKKGVLVPQKGPLSLHFYIASGISRHTHGRESFGAFFGEGPMCRKPKFQPLPLSLSLLFYSLTGALTTNSVLSANWFIPLHC